MLSREENKAGLLLLIISFVGFVSLGLPDAVNGVAWPAVRTTYGLELSRLGLVLIGSGGGYFVSSFFAGGLIHRLGIGLLLALSTVLVATSAAGFSLSPIWVAFLACAVLQGLGSGAIDSGLNSYAASHFTPRHMNWLHACYGLGAMLGPLLMTAILASGASWRMGYAVIAGVMLLLALLFTATRRRFGAAPSAQPVGTCQTVGIRATLRHPLVRLQVVLFFLYTGLEVTVGQWTFTLFTLGRNIDPDRAGIWVGLYWGSLGMGRVLLGFIVGRVGVDRLLRLSMLGAVCGAALFTLAGEGPLPFLGLAMIGFCLAPIFPGLMTRTPQRLGAAYAAHAIGFQVSAAMLGGAALPALVGILSQRLGLSMVPTAAIVLCCLIFLLHECLILRTR